MMVLVTQRTYLIPRIQSVNVAAVMVLLNELPNAPGNIKYIAIVSSGMEIISIVSSGIEIIFRLLHCFLFAFSRVRC